jgi:hypothetical protein
MQTTKCKKCGKKIDQLDVFPEGLCVDCHEEKYNEQEKNAGFWEKQEKDIVESFKGRILSN